MSFISRIRNEFRRVAWRRVRQRVEERINPVEQRLQAVAERLDSLEGLDARLRSLEGMDARLRSLENRDEPLRSLEAAWQQHAPALLNAAATVGALGHEAIALRKSLDAAIGGLREDIRREHAEAQAAIQEIRKERSGVRKEDQTATAHSGPAT